MNREEVEEEEKEVKGEVKEYHSSNIVTLIICIYSSV